MENIKILIDLSGIQDKTTLTSAIKAYSLNQHSPFLFLIKGKKEDMVLFSGYDKIRPYDEKEDSDGIDVFLKKEESKNQDRLLYLFHKKDKTRSYLLIMSRINQDSIDKARQLVSRIFEVKNISCSIVSEEEEISDASSFVKRVAHKDILSSHEPLMAVKEKDFLLLSHYYDAIVGLIDEDRETRKSVFSDIGSFFFKNYMPSNRLPSLKDFLSDYEILLDEPKLTLNLLKEVNTNDYTNIFLAIERLMKD